MGKERARRPELDFYVIMMLYGSMAFRAAVGGDLPQLGTDTHESLLPTGGKGRVKGRI